MFCALSCWSQVLPAMTDVRHRNSGIGGSRILAMEAEARALGYAEVA